MEKYGNSKLYSSISQSEDLLRASNIKIITTHIIIPAYDNCKNGLVVDLEIKAVQDLSTAISSIGPVAIALERNFARVISIMASLKKQWDCLRYFSYQLSCSNHNFIVSDARSSSLALSIGLLNIYRNMRGKHQVEDISGTGVLRIDGSFQETYLEQQKYFAVKNIEKVEKKFITSSECAHLFDLENLLNQF